MSSEQMARAAYYYLDNVLPLVLTCFVFLAPSSVLLPSAQPSRQISLFVFKRFRTLYTVFPYFAHCISFVLIFLRTLFTNRISKKCCNSLVFRFFRTLSKMMGGWHTPSPFSILELASFRWQFAAGSSHLELRNHV